MTPVDDEMRWWSAHELADAVQIGSVHPVEVVDAAIARVERLDPGIGSVVIQLFDRARRKLGKSFVGRCKDGQWTLARECFDQTSRLGSCQQRLERACFHRRVDDVVGTGHGLN